MPPDGGFKEEVKNVKIWFLSHNFMINIGGATNTEEAQSRNMMNNCNNYGFNNLIIFGSYGGHRRHMTYEGRRTTPWVWHKLPTGE